MLKKNCYKYFYDYRKNQYYFYDYNFKKHYATNNQWYWDNKKRCWYMFNDKGAKITTKENKIFESRGRFITIL